MTSLPVASITRPTSRGRVPGAATAAIRSPSIATSQSPTPSGVTTCPPRITKSIIVPSLAARRSCRRSARIVSVRSDRDLGEDEGAAWIVHEQAANALIVQPLPPEPRHHVDQKMVIAASAPFREQVLVGDVVGHQHLARVPVL